MEQIGIASGCEPVIGWRGRPGIVVAMATVIAAGLALHGLGLCPLLDAEARYAIVARKMLASGDWIQPRLNTFPYYEKPPLLYWAIALSYRAFGVSEFGARLPSAVAHVGTTLLVFALARTLLGVGAAMFAGLIYATAVGPLVYARYSFPDGLLVFWLTLSLLGLARAVHHGTGWVLFYLGAAGAGLSKGLFGLVLPIVAAVTYTLVARDVDIIARLRPSRGILILLGLFLPWHIALAARDRAFLPFYVLNEHIYRFLNVREPIDYVPLSVVGFWASSVFWLLPWALFLPAALFWSRRTAAPIGLPLVWATIVIGFFSLARSRLERYGLPALPPLAVVIAGYWQALTEQPRRGTAITIPALLLVLLALAMIAVVFLTPLGDGALAGLVDTLDGHYREHPDQVRPFAQQAMGLVPSFSILLLAWGVATWVAARAGRVRLALLLWVAFLVPGFLFIEHTIGLLGASRSQREAAEIIERDWEDGARVIVGGLYDDAMSVTFYTRRPTYFLEGNSTDLAFGARHVTESPLMLTSAQLDELWQSQGRLFLLADRRRWPAHAYILLEGPTYTLVTNHPPRPPRHANGAGHNKALRRESPAAEEIDASEGVVRRTARRMKEV